jgi:glutamate synthase domain-containing protein 3
MSGGIAYVLDEAGDFAVRCNDASVSLETASIDDLVVVRDLLERHALLTGSELAKRLLRTWRQTRERFIKVMPEEYRRALRRQLELVS